MPLPSPCNDDTVSQGDGVNESLSFIQRIQGDSYCQDQSNGTVLIWSRISQEIEPVSEKGNHQCPKEGADDSPLSSKERRSSNDRGGNGLKLVANPHGGMTTGNPGGEDNTADAGQQS